jgi:hypothetical protein
VLAAIPPDLPTRYNLAPRMYMLIAVDNTPNWLDIMRRGLVPAWAQDGRVRYRTIDARAKTVSKVRPIESRCAIIAVWCPRAASTSGGRGPAASNPTLSTCLVVGCSPSRVGMTCGIARTDRVAECQPQFHPPPAWSGRGISTECGSEPCPPRAAVDRVPGRCYDRAVGPPGRISGQSKTLAVAEGVRDGRGQPTSLLRLQRAGESLATALPSPAVLTGTREAQ